MASSGTKARKKEDKATGKEREKGAAKEAAKRAAEGKTDAKKAPKKGAGKGTAKDTPKSTAKGAAKGAAKSAAKKAKKGGKKHRFTAATADKYELYQLAVQSPEEDAKFLRRTFQRIRKRKPSLMREDFCGTAALSSAWVAQGPEYRAIGYDLDPEPIAWGREHNLAPLGAAAERVELILDDARKPGERVDIRVAQNFSYWVFNKRKELLDYFRVARESLVDDGIFVIDLYGGSEATEEMEEERKIEEGFTYVWDQHAFWPGSGEFVCHIHFRFRDGTKMNKAFSYNWRFWNLTELRDILYDAGFRQVDAYFEGTDENGEDGNGVFEKDERGENCASWIGYLVSQR